MRFFSYRELFGLAVKLWGQRSRKEWMSVLKIRKWECGRSRITLFDFVTGHAGNKKGRLAAGLF